MRPSRASWCKRRHVEATTIEEVRRLEAKAIEFADEGEDEAVAAMMLLVMGMRASEIISRVVRELGRLLWIPETKTETGKGTLPVPEFLRPYLKAIAKGKKPEDLLFGRHWRDWPREWVQRICRAAKVPEVTAHSHRSPIIPLNVPPKTDRKNRTNSWN